MLPDENGEIDGEYMMYFVKQSGRHFDGSFEEYCVCLGNGWSTDFILTFPHEDIIRDLRQHGIAKDMKEVVRLDGTIDLRVKFSDLVKKMLKETKSECLKFLNDAN